MRYSYVPLPEECRGWLREKRCLNDEMIERAGLHYTINSDRKGCIAIPHARCEKKVLSYKLRIAPGFSFKQEEKWRFDPKKVSPVFGKDYWAEQEPKKVYICEGELDCLLLIQEGTTAITSSTGVSSTNACLDHLPPSVEEIVFVLDNDKAGKDGTVNVAREARARWPKMRLREIEWRVGMKKGGDITDLALHCRAQSDDFLTILSGLTREVDESLLGVSVQGRNGPSEGWTQTPRDTEPPITELVELADILKRTREIGLTDFFVEVLLATFISKDVEKRCPLWLLIVGAPSSNKTEGIKLLKDLTKKESYMLDVMTANPFVSGMAAKENPQDLLPQLNGKCFLMKDYTAFFGRSEETVKQLLSDLVAIYDGEFSKHSGSRGTISYKVTFSHIGAITPLGLQKRQQYMNMVGPRFLTLRLPALSDEEHDAGFEIAWSEELDALGKEAQRYTMHFVRIVCESIRKDGVKLAPVSKEIRSKINILAKLIAHTRGIVQTTTQKFENNEGEQRTYQEVEEIQKEEPFRALHQLKVLCRCLAILRGKEEVTLEEVKIARRVALSSMPVHRAEVLSVFQTHDQVTAKETSEILHQNYKTAKRHLDELFHLGVLAREKEELPFTGVTSTDGDDKKDGKAWVYKPHPRFEKVLRGDVSDDSKLADTPPDSTAPSLAV